MGKHTTHVLKSQSVLRRFVAQHCFSRNAVRTRSLLARVALLAAVPAVTCHVLAQHSARLAPGEILVDPNIFEIDPHAIGDTKVVTTIAGGKTVYEADNA
jgi:predicted amidohydrolase YtcJ